jgi:hypothetical protein
MDRRVTLMPRDLKARDEWPDPGVSESIGPVWPKLKQSVYYVTDNRYTQPPEYPNAKCGVRARSSVFRGGAVAKRIELWYCELNSPQR